MFPTSLSLLEENDKAILLQIFFKAPAVVMSKTMRASNPTCYEGNSASSGSISGSGGKINRAFGPIGAEMSLSQY